jgi:transposase
MSQKSGSPKLSFERIVKDICRATRKQYSAEEKIRIVLDGLRGEHGIAELCQREDIAESLYYIWSKEFLEAGTFFVIGCIPFCRLHRHTKINTCSRARRTCHPCPQSGVWFHMVVKIIIT